MDIQNAKAEINFTDNYVKRLKIETSRPPRDNQDVNVNMAIDYTISEIEVVENKLFGKVELVLEIKLIDKEGTFIYLELINAGLFNSDSGYSQKDKFHDMLELNGIMILYQLSRSLITSVTAQAGILPPITLPLINIFKVIENKKSLEQKENNKDV
jgi:preprotein translocase subunit SecB